MTCGWPLATRGFTASRRAGMLLFTEASLGLCPGPVPHTSDGPRTQECTHRQAGQVVKSYTATPSALCCSSTKDFCAHPLPVTFLAVDSDQRVLSLREQQPASRDACAAASPSLEAQQPLHCSGHPVTRPSYSQGQPCPEQNGRGKGTPEASSAVLLTRGMFQ